MEDSDFACSVHSGSLDNFIRKDGFKVLFHEEVSDRRGDSRENEYCIVICKTVLNAEHDKAHSGNLSRNHHNGDDECLDEFSSVEAIDMCCISGKCGEVDSQYRVDQGQYDRVDDGMSQRKIGISEEIL